jgi:hypothetical protein
MTPARPGGNNRVFRVDCADGRFALKFYPAQAADPRDRLGAEWKALTFMVQAGFDCVPVPVAVDREQRGALYGWIDGTAITHPNSAGVDALANFLTAVHGLRSHPEAANIGPASDACLAAGDACRIVERRLDRLRAVASEAPDLAGFLEDEFVPVASPLVTAARAGLTEAGVDPAAPLPPAFRTLNPSDFGLHNALRRPDGRFAFVDFEYLGWDDPVKEVSDVLLHPGLPLGAELGRRLEERLRSLFAADPLFETRLRLLFPVFALIWCEIMLNEFLPERWERRRLAGNTSDRAAAQVVQLDKAARLLRRIKEGCPSHVAA